MIVVTYILLLVGIIQMAVASFFASKLQKKTKNINFERKWLFIQILIFLFLLSYIGMLEHIIRNPFLNFFLWIATVYCFGASFVLLMLIFAKQSLSALINRQESFLHDLFESLDHPLFVIDSDSSKVLLSNRAAKENIANSDTEKFYNIHIGKKLIYENGQDLLSVVKESGKTSVINYTVHDNKNGTDRNYEIRAYPVINKQNKLDKIIISVMDISASIKAEKLNAINAMIITYNHQINNPLTIAIGSLKIGIKEQKEESAIHPLKSAEEALNKVVEIVQKISKIQVIHEIKYDDYVDNKMIKLSHIK